MFIFFKKILCHYLLIVRDGEQGDKILTTNIPPRPFLIFLNNPCLLTLSSARFIEIHIWVKFLVFNFYFYFLRVHLLINCSNKFVYTTFKISYIF